MWKDISLRYLWAPSMHVSLVCQISPTVHCRDGRPGFICCGFGRLIGDRKLLALGLVLFPLSLKG